MLRMVMVGFSLVLCAQVWSQSQGQRGQVLRWKWHEGQVLRYRTTQELGWTMTGGQQDSTNEWTIIYEIRQEVTQVDADGIATVEQTYESANIIASDADEQVRYNSMNKQDEAKKEHRLIKPFAAFVDKTIVFKVGPEGKVHSLKGASKILDEALDATGESNPLMMGITAMFRATLSDESVRKGLEQQLRVVPDKPVKQGDTWSVKSEQSMPLVGALITEVEYELKRIRPGRRATTALIEVAGEITQKESGGGLVPALKVASLDDSTVKGEITFDVTYGRIDKSTLEIAMTFKIELGAALKMEYKLKQRGDMQLLSAR